VKILLPLLLTLSFLALVHAGPEKKRYIVYAEFQQDTMVDLSDGSKWAMDKGDCFPIYMYKEHQTKVVLQLGAATFWTDATRVRVMNPDETDKAVVSYQKNLQNYLHATKLRPARTREAMSRCPSNHPGHGRDRPSSRPHSDSNR